MAKTLQTPIINNITPFDPTASYTVSFSYSDNQAVKNRAIVQDTDTYKTVYDKIQTGMSLTHTLPANTLRVGKRYVIQIQVFDEDGNSSQLSDQMSFYCYSTPSFYLKDINSIIKNSSISLSVFYSQAEGESIKSFQFYLYDNTKIKIDNSSTYYSLDNNTYSFNSLDNLRTYYVRAIGETVHGIYLDTGYVEFTTSYATIPANIAFNVENNYNGGYITITSNIKDIEHNEQGCTINDGILTIENGFLEYNDGFEIVDDMYLRLRIKQIPTGRFFQTNDEKLTLTLIKVCDLYYIELRVDKYVLYKQVEAVLLSNNQYCLTTSGNSLYIEILRENDIYDIRTGEEI